MHTIIAKIIYLEANLSMVENFIHWLLQLAIPKYKFSLNLSISAHHCIVSVDIIKKEQPS